MSLRLADLALFMIALVGGVGIFALGMADATLPLLLFGLPVAGIGFVVALHRAQAALLALVFLIPLDFFGQVPGFSGSFSLFKLVFPVVLLSYVVDWIRGRAQFAPFSGAERVLFAFVCFNLLMVPFAANIPDALTFARKLVSMALLYLMISRHALADAGFRRRLDAVLVVSSVVSVVLGWWGASAGANLFSSFRDDDLARSTGASTVSPNDFAYMLFLPAFVALARALAEPRLRRWLWGFGAVAIAGGVVMTYSRSAFLAFAVAGAFALLLVWRKLGGLHWMAIAVCMVVGVAALPTKYVDRLASLATMTEQRQTVQELSLMRRANYLTVGWRIFKDHPVLGAGPGNFGYLHASPRYQGIPFLFNVERMPHNMYLQAATETGAVGLALFLAALALFGRDAMRSMRGRQDLGAAAFPAAVVAGVIATLAMGLFLHLIINKSFWLMLAYVRAAGAEKTDDG